MATMQPQIFLYLDARNGPIYTTNASVRGSAEIRVCPGSKLKAISILLEGKTVARVESVRNLLNNAGHFTGHQMFLQLSQPLDKEKLLNGSKAPNLSLTIPFHFTLPGRLLPYTCTHEARHEDEVKQHHTRLPPSLEPFEDDQVELQNMCSNTTRVSYTVHASATIETACGRSLRIKTTIPLLVVPTREAYTTSPPLLKNTYYHLEARSHKSSIPGFRGPSAYLCARTSPVTFWMNRGNNEPSSPAPALQVAISFFPAKPSDEPPRLTSVSTKLRAFTFSSAVPFETLPKNDEFYEANEFNAQSTSSISLKPFQTGSVSWCRDASWHPPSAPPLYDIAPCSTPLAGLSDARLAPYVALLQIPVDIPHNTKSGKRIVLVPEFNSCHITRTYRLDVKLGFEDEPRTKLSSVLKHVKRPVELRLEAPASVLLRSESGIKAGSGEGFQSGKITPGPETLPSDPNLLSTTSRLGSLLTSARRERDPPPAYTTHD